MGSCVSSSQKKSSSVPDSTFISKPDSSSPLNLNDDLLVAPPPINSSEEEVMFFDSRCWLDSDCEDDFMSVDGGFTPSRETTPVHPRFCDQTTPERRDQEPSPSPTDNKKRLLELFKETQDEGEEDDAAEGKARACLWLRTPARSSAPPTPYNLVKERDRFKRVRSSAHNGCVPRLISCSSLTERRRKMMTH